MKKIYSVLIVVALAIAILAGCGSAAGSGSAGSTPSGEAASEAMTGAITVISREEGSGTRGAFIELMGIEVKDADGNTVDMTSDLAEVANSTNLVMTSVQSNPKAVGYISLGSLNETVKAVTVDGVEPTVDNILDGTYAIARPFNIASMNGEFSDVAADFIAYIFSDEGQQVVVVTGYISTGSTGAYTGSGMSGDIVCAGSTSVSPLMEKLAEAYMAINPDVDIEIQATGSSAGMTSAIDGTCDIGMASRELKDSELQAGLVPSVIAKDGIAVVVSNDNSVNNLTSAEITSIFTGEITDWSEIAG
ncbi:MAG: phosphate ABC transporter substrate-binding protein [Clostridia bacterium]|nr:phosphate ABC transporter substrate-binding protein [Clostridia bacterium]